jgi:hypothetical protein
MDLSLKEHGNVETSRRQMVDGNMPTFLKTKMVI